VAVRAPGRARGHGASRRARCRRVAERATALKARVLHARAWNTLEKDEAMRIAAMRGEKWI